MSVHPEVIIPEGEPGETHGHDGVHEELAVWWNDREASTLFEVPPGASEAELAAIVGDCHAAGGGTVVLQGRAYTLAADAAILITLPTVSIVAAGSAATVLTYTGSGDCIRVEPDPTTVTQMGKLKGFTIDGSGAAAGAKGVHHVDAGTAMHFDDVVIRLFAGADSVGCCYENVTLYNERASGVRLQLLHNSIGMQLIGADGDPDPNSFFYHRWSDLRLNVGAGQIGLQAKGTALLQGGDWNVLGNIDGTGGIFFDLADTAVWAGIMWFKGERTSGDSGIGRRVGESATWAAGGSFNADRCTDEGTIYSPWEFRPDGVLLRNFPAVPTVTMQAGAGTSPPGPVVGTTSNSSRGSVIVGTGTAVPAGPSILFRVEYATPFATVPIPRVWAYGLNAHYLRPFISAVTTTYFEVAVEVAPGESQPNSTYGFFYSVDG